MRYCIKIGVIYVTNQNEKKSPRVSPTQHPREGIRTTCANVRVELGQCAFCHQVFNRRASEEEPSDLNQVMDCIWYQLSA